jgi:phage baseplate assembly protein W
MNPPTIPNTHHWQARLGEIGGVATDLADIATDLADIGQSLHVIATTPFGADPLRPDFGCDMWRYIDWPVNRAIPHVVRELTAAWRKWEPRIAVVRIVPRIVDGSWLVARLFFTIAAGLEQSLDVALRRAA